MHELREITCMCDDMGFFVGSMVLFTYFEFMSLFLIHTLSHGLIRAMDFMNLAKFHSKPALSFHSKACSHPAATEREVHPFLICGIHPCCFRDIA